MPSTSISARRAPGAPAEAYTIEPSSEISAEEVAADGTSTGNGAAPRLSGTSVSRGTRTGCVNPGVVTLLRAWLAMYAASRVIADAVIALTPGTDRGHQVLKRRQGARRAVPAPERRGVRVELPHAARRCVLPTLHNSCTCAADAPTAAVN